MMQITFCILCVITGIGLLHGTQSETLPRLQFVKEPPYKVDFANTKGTKIECAARGDPKPTVKWILADGTSVTNIEGLRDITPEGNLIFHSFKPEGFRLDVHSAVYQCVASNKIGEIHSRNVQVQGVVLQNYDIQVYDTYAIERNTAVFKCHIPTMFKSYLKISAWIKNSNQIIETSNKGSPNDKYAIMPNGDLHIRDVSMNESGSKYKCKATHSITGQSQISLNDGHLFVTEARGIVPPKIFTEVSRVLVYNGNVAVLPCVVQGNPIPSTKWFKKTSQNQSSLLEIGNRFIQTKSALLIRDTNVGDEGNYVCEATSESGKAIVDIYVNVAVPLSATIEPSLLSVKTDDTVTLVCKISGQPIALTTWLHNGNMIKTAESNVLTISNPNLSNQGFYQCLAKNDEEMVQATAELQLSEVAPHFVQVFDGISMDPGSVINLTCVAFGIPTPTITWSIDDIPLNSSSELRIKMEVNQEGLVVSSLKRERLTTEDGGLYACTAINEAGQSIHWARVNIHGKLGIRTVSKKIAVSGTNLYLNCPFYGSPVEEITWEKDDNVLPSKLGETLFENGTFMIAEVIKLADSGVYTCYVKNSVDKVEGKLDVAVLAPPKIVPFEFQEELLREGMRARLQCVISEGDLPLNVTWLKDGRPLPSKLGVLVRVLDEFSSILTINSITPSHNGKYTCVASNQAAIVTHTAELSVNGKHTVFVLNFSVPPKVIPFAFLDDQFYKGMRAHVTCAISEGDVPLSFMWLKDGLTIPSDLGVSTRNYDKQTSSLSIENVSSRHSGNYTCIVHNRAGKAVYTAQLLVRVPPKIVPFYFGDILYERSPARVVCGLQEGDTPVRFSWLHNRVPVIADDNLSFYEVDGLSSILSIRNLSEKHAGVYTCLAENGAGVAHYDAVLLVNVPPKIVPFTFQDDNVVEGLLARVSCVISRGDVPLRIHWEKDGLKLKNGDLGVQIRSFDDHSSILSIPSVATVHNGLYSCVASNEAGSAKHSPQLAVQVPPRWVVTPSDVSVMKGDRIMLNCVAEGFPKPEIVWKKLTDPKQTSLSKSLFNSDNIHLYQNGSLLIRSVKAHDEAFYYCQASNGIGRGLSVRVKITIHAPPVFKNALNELYARMGEETQLQCLAQGDAPIKFVWYKNDKVIQNNQEGHKIQTTNTASDALSLLTIQRSDREANGKYQCVAENAYGVNNATITLYVLESPDAPHNLKSVATGSTTVELSWETPYNGNNPINKYVIQYKGVQESWDNATTMETANGEPTNSIVSQLQPATNYFFRVFAENNQGVSLSSQILHVVTEESVPTGPPQDVQIETVNTDTFKVMWKAPLERTWNGKILGYYIGYKEVDTEDPFLYKTLVVSGLDNNDLSVQISGLKQFTKYAVTVQSFNGQGKGPESEPVIMMTSEGAPSLPPTDIHCTTLTSQKIHVTWTAPPSDSINGILRGYKVVYKPASEWFDDMVQNFNVTLTTSTTLNLLEKFTNYSIYVLAMTKAGEGPKSIEVFCKTLDDVPGFPSDIKTIATSDDSIMVSWKPPENSNGVIKSYKIYWKETSNVKDVSSHTLSARFNHYEITRLKKDQQYDFWVSASTLVGEGQSSKIVSQVPSGPKIPAKVVSFDDKLVTPWKSDIVLPCQVVGIPEPQRKWKFQGKEIEENSRCKMLLDGSLSIKEIKDEDAGEYECSAHNDFGNDQITYVITVLGPPSSPIIEVTATTSNAIEMQWKPASSKMSRIKGYTIHIRKDAGSWKEITVGDDARSYRINGLDCGTRYEVYLTAFNKIGIGASSEVVILSTNGSVPIAPSNSELIEEASNSISLYLSSWKNGGCPIQYFMVEYTPKSINEWVPVSGNVKPEQKRLVIPGLKPSTWYGLRMTAQNSAGSTIAKYDFATLTPSGATIIPELQADAPHENMEGIMATLNVYIIVPIVCTAIILVAIFAMACMCVKMRSRNAMPVEGDTVNITNTGTLRRGDSSESFAYMKRQTLNRQSAGVHNDIDLTPYATFQLSNQELIGTLRHMRNNHPMSSPHHFNTYPNNDMLMMNQHVFPPCASFIPAPPQDETETTFVFPTPPPDNIMDADVTLPNEYQNDIVTTT